MSAVVQEQVREQGMKIHRLTAEDFYRMIDAGILGPKNRVELWDGQLVEKMGKNQPHQISMIKLLRMLNAIFQSGWFVSPEGSIQLDLLKVPEPDIAIVRGEPEDYPKRPPKAKDVGLLIEIADSSIRIDQGIKKAAYAGRKIPVYWIVNLVERRVEVYSKPEGRGKKADYRRLKTYAGNELVPLELDGAVVAQIEAKAILP